jgi:hypothetical protein
MAKNHTHTKTPFQDRPDEIIPFSHQHPIRGSRAKAEDMVCKDLFCSSLTGGLSF